MAWAAMKKNLYSLRPLQRILASANHRYLEFISAIDDPSQGIRHLHKISRTVFDKRKAYRGFNFFDDEDEAVFEAIRRGEINISGFQKKHLHRHLPNKSAAQVSRVLKRLRLHGLIKKVAHTYKYYLTKLGRLVLIAGLKLKQIILIPELAHASQKQKHKI